MLMATQSPVTVVAVTSVMLSLDMIVVGLRFTARKWRAQPLKADDWLSLVAVLLACGLATTLFVGVAQDALAYPTPAAPLRARTSISESNKKIITVARLEYIFLVMSIPTLGAIKLSVLCFYRRIFVVDKYNKRNVHNLIYIFLVCVISLWMGGFLFSFMFACKGHFSAWWTSALSLITKCINTLEVLFAFAVSDFISDAIVIVLPIPMIWKLHLPIGRKLGVLLVFLLGTLATIASLIRMIWVVWARNVGFDESLDEDLLITTMLFWCMLEVTLGIIASCLPTLRALFQHKSVDSVVRSVRSKIAIRPWRTLSSDSLEMVDVEHKVCVPNSEA